MRDSVLVSVGIRPVSDISDCGWFQLRGVGSVERDGGRGQTQRTQAGEGVDTINVHGTATADTLTAGATEGEGGVLLVLYPNEGIEHHGAGLVQVQLVGLHSRLLARGVRVPTVNLEGLHLGWGLGGSGLTSLDGRIGASEGSGTEEGPRRSKEPRRRAEGGHDEGDRG